MKARIGSLILCVCMVAGIAAAGVTTTDKEPDLPTEEADHELVNALGMPLLDDTALLITVSYTRLSDRYHYIIDQYEYDREGRILRQLEQGVLGLENTLHEYTYDADGRVIRENVYCAGFQEKNWELDFWREYSYAKVGNDGGKNKTEREYEAGGNLLYEFVYDSEDRLLEKKEYSEYRDYALYSEYEYDQEQQQDLWTYYDGQGEIESQTKKQYDDAGNEILYAEYDAEGKVLFVHDCGCGTGKSEYYSYRRYENQYDDQGNLLKRITYDYENNEAARLENTYDGQGNLTRRQYEDYQDKFENYLDKYTYDTRGNLVWEYHSDEWDERGRVILYSYDDQDNRVMMRSVREEYDENGNGTPERHDNVIWERTYDEQNRVVQYINYQNTDGSVRQYDYTYETIGIPEEQYPYEKITIRDWY